MVNKRRKKQSGIVAIGQQPCKLGPGKKRKPLKKRIKLSRVPDK